MNRQNQVCYSCILTFIGSVILCFHFVCAILIIWQLSIRHFIYQQTCCLVRLIMALWGTCLPSMEKTWKNYWWEIVKASQALLFFQWYRYSKNQKLSSKMSVIYWWFYLCMYWIQIIKFCLISGILLKSPSSWSFWHSCKTNQNWNSSGNVGKTLLSETSPFKIQKILWCLDNIMLTCNLKMLLGGSHFGRSFILFVAGQYTII